jgi:hypothetical protein
MLTELVIFLPVEISLRVDSGSIAMGVAAEWGLISPEFQLLLRNMLLVWWVTERVSKGSKVRPIRLVLGTVPLRLQQFLTAWKLAKKVPIICLDCSGKKVPPCYS